LDDQFRVDLLFAMEGIDDTQQFLGIHAAFFRWLMVKVCRPNGVRGARGPADSEGSFSRGQGYLLGGKLSTTSRGEVKRD
jgi:hypothetical protein